MRKIIFIFFVGLLGSMNVFAMGEDPQTSGLSNSSCCETCRTKNPNYAATHADCGSRYATPRKDSSAVGGGKRSGGKGKKGRMI